MSRKIKILYVHHGRGLGGAPLSLLYTIQGLDRAIFDAHVLFIHDDKDVQQLYAKNGISFSVDTKILDLSHTEVSSYGWLNPFLYLRLFWSPVSYFRFKEFFRKQKPDIVHLNTSSLWVAALAAKHLDIPVVWHLREPLAKGFLGIRRSLLKRMIDRDADAAISISHYDASFLIPSSKLAVVHNFVDLERFSPHASAEKFFSLYPHLKKKKIVLMVGGISRLKGTDVFVESLPAVLKKVSDVMYVVVGEKQKRDLFGSFEKRIHRFVKRNHLQKSILFLEKTPDIVPYLAACSVLVFPSTRPHFARPIIEASAMGKPVVGSDLGGPQELILDGKTGFLTPTNNPNTLAERLVTLLTDRQRARRYGVAGRAFATQNFDQKKNVKRIVSIYEKILNRTHGKQSIA